MSIYLDGAATTPVQQEVIDKIVFTIKDNWYNPSALYAPSVEISAEVEKARKIIADSIKAEKSKEIYFTSGGSEANSWAIQGFVKKYPHSNIIISPLEHKSITECCKNVCRNLYVMRLNEKQTVDLEYLEHLLKDYCDNAPTLISCQMVNNEVGIVQPIADIAKLARRYHAYLHVDAVQAYPYIPINVKDLDIDMMSVSGHKIGTPKGIGFLYIDDKLHIKPIIYGTQERGIRGGTENVPYIMGLAEAVNKHIYYGNTTGLHHFKERLKCIGCRINCDYSRSDNIEVIPNIISCTLPEGCSAEAVVNLLGVEGIYASTGSACNTLSGEPSYVLRNIGLSDDEIYRTMRFSCTDISIDNAEIVIEKMKRIFEYIKTK